ncbi:hypothetical protein [Endozoicomonas sp. ALB032]|uniref:hypothetical protein n=1 Tax=Endozoicomonas sp. ALB032 TaxID=3403082 RepID=UPI003BB5D904
MPKILILLLSITLASCASVPANFGPPSPTSKIGLFLLIDDYPKHEHVGNTIFQNKEVNASSDTDFKQKYYEKIAEIFAVKNYELVKLKENEDLYEKRFSLFSYASSNIYFKSDVKSVFNQVAVENGLDFIIVVHPLNGPAWPNSSAYIDGYGLYTGCKFGSCTAEALDHVSARFYDVKNQSSLKPMGFRYYQRPTIPEINPSKSIESITSEEIDLAATKALEKFMGQFRGMAQASGFVQ